MKAFPNPTLSDPTNCSPETINDDSQYGLTVRDYFAAKVMQGILSNPSHSDSDDQVVKDSYKIADAMMSERSES